MVHIAMTAGFVGLALCSLCFLRALQLHYSLSRLPGGKTEPLPPDDVDGTWEMKTSRHGEHGFPCEGWRALWGDGESTESKAFNNDSILPDRSNAVVLTVSECSVTVVAKLDN